MKPSRSILVALVCLVTTVALSTGVLSACGSSSGASSAAPTAVTSPASDPAAGAQPVASPSPAQRLVTADAWAIQFEVSSWLPQVAGSASPGSGAMLFNSEMGASEGGLLALVCAGDDAPDTDAMVALLNDPQQVLGLLPGGVGEGGQVTVRRSPTATTIGRQSWPAVSAEYTVTLASDKEPLFQQRMLELEVFLFEHDGHLYELSLLTAPATSFATHRTDLELTPATLEPLSSTASPGASPSTTPGITPTGTPTPGQTTSPPTDATTSAIVSGIHSIQVGVQSWAVDHGTAYPDSAVVTQAGLGRPYVDTWPTNPVTHGPMLPTGGPGNYTYQQLDGGQGFRLTGYGADGSAVITVP